MLVLFNMLVLFKIGFPIFHTKDFHKNEILSVTSILCVFLSNQGNKNMSKSALQWNFSLACSHNVEMILKTLIKY